MVKVATVCLAIVALVGSAAAVSYPSHHCPSNEVLVASPPCCEPTCDCDCEHATCQQMLVYQPTCVCMTGFVRMDGQCVPKSCCPAPETEPPCYTTTVAPVYHQPSCGCEQKPCQCAQPAYHPAPVHQPCQTTYEPSTCAPPVYEKPSCGCGQYPCKCVQPEYHPAPVYHHPYETTTYAPVYEHPSCGCGQNPCKCAQPEYHPAPVYHHPYETTCAPVETTTTYAPVYEHPSCGCGQNPCKCVQPVYHPAPVYHPPCETTTLAPVYETPAPVYETPAPTCAPCEQLVFAHPCCEPTCDNDCSGVKCSPLLLVEEPTCACRPGLVRYQGHCVEPTVCPKSASRYRVYVPQTVSCACNNHNVVVY